MPTSRASSAVRVLLVAAAASSAMAITGCGKKPEPQPAPDASSEVAAEAPPPSASAESVEAPASASAVASAITAPSASADPQAARAAALRDAQGAGIIGALNQGVFGDPNAAKGPWGIDDGVGTDALSARGHMWGDSIGEGFGAGGLGLSGIGEGGGGRGEGMGLGSVGSLGHGAGTGQGFGNGGGAGRLAKPRGSVAISSRVVSGSLPPEVVTRILRARVAMLQACYESALKTDPTLAGDVALELTIDTKGAAGDVRNPGEASAVGLCMTKALAGTSFPAPEGGPCSVSASVKLTPPEKAAKVDKPATGDSLPKIHGKALADAQASDVAEAMRTAGCTDVVIGSKNDAIVITAKYRDADLTVTFAPAGGRPVAVEEAKRLRGAAVLVEADGMFLAIEGPRTIAESLRRAIVVASAG